MGKLNLLVIDDFYKNPDAVRDAALKLNFKRKENATYPGQEAISNEDWSDVINEIKSFIPEECGTQSENNNIFPQGKFHLCMEKDNDIRAVGVHTDVPKWSAVIYLSKNPNFSGGTYWYMHEKSSQYMDSDDFFKSLMTSEITSTVIDFRKTMCALSLDMTQWIEIQKIAMIYNRLVLFRADHFHANPVLFGSSPADARLTQHFVFYSKGD